MFDVFLISLFLFLFFVCIFNLFMRFFASLGVAQSPGRGGALVRSIRSLDTLEKMSVRLFLFLVENS